MDPDEALRVLLDYASRWQACRDRDEDMSTADAFGAMDVMAEHVLSLDGWLKRQGFLPARWKRL